MDLPNALIIGLRPLVGMLIMVLVVTPLAKAIGWFIPEGRLKRLLFRQIGDQRRRGPRQPAQIGLDRLTDWKRRSGGNSSSSGPPH